MWDHTKHPKALVMLLPNICSISITFQDFRWHREVRKMSSQMLQDLSIHMFPDHDSLKHSIHLSTQRSSQSGTGQEAGRVGKWHPVLSHSVCDCLSPDSFWHDDAEARLVERGTSEEASCSNLQRLNEIYRLHKLGWLDNEIFIVILPLFFEVQNSLSSLGWSLSAWEEFTIKPAVACCHFLVTSTYRRQMIISASMQMAFSQ